jgi:LysM repeat protein
MVYLQVETSREPASVINRFYVVESISHALTGEETLALSHFPVNSEGQSLIALAVANATAPGAILTSNRTGGSCDLAGASSSTTVPAKTTSGTPINPQGTGGGSSITYWAATGAFISLLGGSDSPPGLGGGGSARGSAGNPFGALPRPESGKNAAGGDAICPTGYAPFNPDAYAYFRSVPNVIGGTGWFPTSSHIFVAFASSSLTPRTVAWPGTQRLCVVPPVVGIGGDIVKYGYVSKAISLADITTNDVFGNFFRSVSGYDGCLMGRVHTYEFSNSNSANATVLAKWSGNSNVATITQSGYICNDGTVGIVKIRTVVKGDTLWDIAQAEYGDATRWPEIYAANTDVVGADPDLIFPGQVLRIP